MCTIEMTAGTVVICDGAFVLCVVMCCGAFVIQLFFRVTELWVETNS